VAGDLDEVAKRLESEGTTRPVVAPPAARSQQMSVSPREAFLGASEVLPVDEAVGRISCESIAGYPPGIPALLPGERITEAVVAYLRELVDTGARLHGASDPAFRRVHVLQD
jgi:arginine/lysine/ornithine decarboxylase